MPTRPVDPLCTSPVDSRMLPLVPAVPPEISMVLSAMVPEDTEPAPDVMLIAPPVPLKLPPPVMLTTPPVEVAPAPWPAVIIKWPAQRDSVEHG